MHTCRPLRWRRGSIAALAATLVLLVASSASALQTTLNVEFATGLTGNFATVDIVENQGKLEFSIVLDTSLGPACDLHDFYFNILGEDISGLMLVSDDAPVKPYELQIYPAIHGGAGTHFDYGVSFGNGTGDNGNGQLTSAMFTLMADQPLSIEDLLSRRYVSPDHADQQLGVHLALHVQGTNLIEGAEGGTVGGNIVPEPSTALMASIGLLGLAVRGRALKGVARK